MSDASTVAGRGLPPRPAPIRPRHKRGAMRWWVLALLFVFLAFMLAPIFLALNNAVKTASDYATHGPLALPQSFTIEGLLGFWDYVDFTKKIWNSLLLSGCAALFGVALSVFNAYAIGIGRIKGGRVMLVILLLGIMIPQESLVYPLYYMSKSRRALRFAVVGHHHLHGAAVDFRHLSARRRDDDLPARNPRSGAGRRRQSLAGAVVCGHPDPQADHGGSGDLLFHLDLERVPDSAGHAGLQHQPDRFGRHGRLERAIRFPADDHRRRGAAGHHCRR